MMNRLLTSALAITCVAMSMPVHADNTRPASEQEKTGVSKPGDVSPLVAQAMVDDVTLGTAVTVDGHIPADGQHALLDDIGCVELYPLYQEVYMIELRNQIGQ